MIGCQQTMKIFLLVSVLNVVIASVEETDKKCDFDQSCLVKEDCSSFLEKHKTFLGLRNQQSSQYSKLRKELTAAVCNKEKKGVCCPKCKPFNECIDRNKCEYANEKTQEYKELKIQNKRTEADKILQELRGRVCEKEKRFICCPTQHPVQKPRQKVSNTLLSYQLPQLGSCGVSLFDASNIVGGQDTRPGEYPFSALLGYVVQRKTGGVRGRPGRTTDETRWSCAGTLINNWYVLTAAHCQGKSPERRISKLRLGAWKVRGYGERSIDKLPAEQNFDINEADVTVHEDYATVYENDHKNVVNDIALIRLPRSAILNKGVQIACLPAYPQEFKTYLHISDEVSGLVGKKPSVTGWGKTNAHQLVNWDGVGSRKQQYLKIPVLSKEQCIAKNSNFIPRATQMCAGGIRGEDSCRGDSGGGLFIQQSEEKENTPWYLIGIVSFGSRECGNGRAGLYTRVSEFIPWIKTNLK